jgi:hypothetical protein
VRIEVLQTNHLRFEMLNGPQVPGLLEEEMKRLLALMAVCAFVIVVASFKRASATQNRPATIEGCRDALHTTRAEMPRESGDRTLYLRRLDLASVAEKSSFMASCANVDDDPTQYTLFSDLYAAEEFQRYQHFLERHRLVNKLLQEDTAGER